MTAVFDDAATTGLAAHERALGEFVAALCEGLVAGGVRHVCLCPGSRSTPIAIAVQRHPALRSWMHLDERSCAYFALGLAKARREPVAIVCTSGTAALNFAPAVAEASLAGVPLVVLTADRPPELRGIGANQTVDQRAIYGGHAKTFVELPVPVAGEPSLARFARHWGRRAAALAVAAPAGPVHLNLPFREPLFPKLPSIPDAADPEPSLPAPPPRTEPSPGSVVRLLSLLHDSPHGIIVCGPQHAPEFSQAVTGLAARLGYPILADPLSQLRRGPHDRTHVMDAYDAFLRSPSDDLQPDVVLRFAATPTSKPLAQFLARSEATQIVVAGPGGWNDPDLVAHESLDADPTAVCRRLTEAVDQHLGDAEWIRAWTARNGQAAVALDAQLGATTLSEPRAIRELIDALPDGATLFAGNSMPVRDVDSVLRSDARLLALLGNRGASGIDGVVSTALGVAAGGKGPVALVLGDLSLYHDMNGLLAARRFGLDATIVVLNNDGGGIFSLLPQAERVPEFEELFGTPHGMSFEHAAAQYVLEYGRPDSIDDYRDALRRSIGQPGVQLIEVRTDRAENAALHRRLWSAGTS